jgi:solute carrier family 25 (mitochondrial carnitine/acylcarnitine transporter), member 20/29
MVRTFKDVIRREGFMALYKGLIPPLVGSTIFRSIQFGVYNAAYTFMKDWEPARSHIPFSAGVEWRVILAGICSSSARSVIETPLEVIKIRRQLNQPWTFRSLYTGFWITWMRTTGLMCTFFLLVDTGYVFKILHEYHFVTDVLILSVRVRHFPEIINAPLYGPFIKVCHRNYLF